MIYDDADIEIISETYDSIPDGVVLNTEVKQFSFSIYKKFKKIWVELQKEFKHIGYTYVISIPLEEEDVRWNEHWGFKDTGLRVDGHKVMRFDLW
jgi:hypothetical protein